MQAQRLNIMFPADIARELRRMIPTRSRSKFVAEAVSDKLSKKKKMSKKEWIKGLKANREFYKKIAEEWKATEVEGWPD